MSTSDMEIDAAGLDLEKKYEQRRLQAYDDARPAYKLQPGDKVIGTLTIGWGHTGPEVHIGLTWTPEQCDQNLKADNERFQKVMRRLVKIQLTQNEWDALCVFVLNVGPGNFADSTLLKKLNAGDIEGAALQFPAWDKSHGVELAGLLKRRLEEQALFRQGSATELAIDAKPGQPDTLSNS